MSHCISVLTFVFAIAAGVLVLSPAPAATDSRPESAQIELSGANAQTKDLPQAGRITSEARLYEKLRPSVFLMATDSGLGTGFLVDLAGLLLTNRHSASAALAEARQALYEIESPPCQLLVAEER